MNNVMKRETAKQPASFGSAIDQIFQNNLSRFFDDSFWGSNGLNIRQSAPVNISETDKTYEMEMAVPGWHKEDFHLNTAADTLTITAEPKGDNASQQYLRQEFRKQPFTRSFTLDDTVDAAGISARYDNGILYISLPKKESAQKISRNIEIQ